MLNYTIIKWSTHDKLNSKVYQIVIFVVSKVYMADRILELNVQYCFPKWLFLYIKFFYLPLQTPFVVVKNLFLLNCVTTVNEILKKRNIKFVYFHILFHLKWSFVKSWGKILCWKIKNKVTRKLLLICFYTMLFVMCQYENRQLSNVLAVIGRKRTLLIHYQNFNCMW